MGKVKFLFSVVTGILECVTCAGLIFGWSSITDVLIKEGYFLGDCPTPDVTNNTDDDVIDCVMSMKQGQKKSLAFVFTVASMALNLSTILNGIFFDRYGTFPARMFASTLFLLATVMMIVSSPGTSWLLYIAMSCYAVGGVILLVTNVQLGNLFSDSRSSIITAFNGGMDSSSFIFLAVKLAYDAGYSLYAIFTVLIALVCFQVLRTFIFMPKKLIPFPLPENFNYGVFKYRSAFLRYITFSVNNSEVQISNDGNISDYNNAGNDENNGQSADVTPIKECLCDSSFWLNCMHLSLLQFRNYIYLALVGYHLQSLTSDSSTVNSYLNAFGTCQLFGVLCAPLNGIIVDRLVKNARGSITQRVAMTKALGWTALITTCFAIMLSILCVIQSLRLQYLTFVLQLAFRSFLFGGNCNFLAMFYPIEHFGKLYGTTMTAGGVLLLLQFPFYSWLFAGGYDRFVTANYIFIGVSVLTLVNPMTLLIKSYSSRK